MLPYLENLPHGTAASPCRRTRETKTLPITEEGAVRILGLEVVIVMAKSSPAA